MFHEKDNHEGIAAYYSSLLFYGKDNFREAEHYADIAPQYPAYAKNAAEIASATAGKLHLGVPMKLSA